MKKIGAGLIGTVYLQDEGHILKVIKKKPRDRWGRSVSRENAIANEQRAIAYNESVPEKFRIFCEAREIDPGKFLKKRLFPADLEKISREEKYRFGAALIHMLKSGYGLVDGIQVMADEKGRLFICDADSFVDFSGLPEEAQNHIAYRVNTFISRELGIGEWITRHCTVEKTITAFPPFRLTRPKGEKESQKIGLPGPEHRQAPRKGEGRRKKMKKYFIDECIVTPTGALLPRGFFLVREGGIARIEVPSDVPGDLSPLYVEESRGEVFTATYESGVPVHVDDGEVIGEIFA